MAASARQLVRDAVALFTGEVLSKLAGFAAFAYLARVLEPSAYGAVELAVALSMFFGLIVDFGFGPIGAREIARDPGLAPPLAARIPAARLLLAVVAVAAMLTTAAMLGQPPETMRLIALFAFALLATAWASRWLFQGLDMMVWASLPQALRMLVFAGGVVLLVKGTDDLWRVGMAELAATAAMAVYFVVVQRVFVAPVRLDFSRAELTRLLRAALPVGGAQLVWAFHQYVPTVLIAVLVGGAEVAWFGSAHRVVMALGTFVWLYHFNLFPSLVRAREAGGRELATLLAQSFRVSAWAGVGCGLAATHFAEPLCRLVYGPGFAAAALPFSIIAWVMPVALLSNHAGFTLIAIAPRLEFLAQACGAMLTLILGIALIPRFGALGAACALLTASLVIWMLTTRLARGVVGDAVPAPWRAWRPVLAASAGWSLVTAFGVRGDVLSGAALLGGYAASAIALDRSLVRDVLSLRRGSVRSGTDVVDGSTSEGPQ